MPDSSKPTEGVSETPRLKKYHRKKILLVFNPGAGKARRDAPSLDEVLLVLNQYRFEPEIFLIEQGCDLGKALDDAIKSGISLVVTCGGDGTSSSTARLLAGKGATLGIIPMGTQNNTALAYDIPADLEDAVRVLREGRKLKVDLGKARVGRKQTYFVEVLSIGLVSDVFPAADDFQHGEIGAIGDFIKTFASVSPSEFEIKYHPDMPPITSPGLVLLAANMPVIGLHYRLGKRSAMQDGKLDLVFFEDASKLDLLAIVARGLQEGLPDVKKVKHILTEKASIKVTPKMSVMYDGEPFGEGNVELSVEKHALTVMIPKRSRVKQSQ